MPAETELFTPRQSNTALYVQLHDAGYATDDIRRAQAAYRLTCRMFNGRYRKTGRAFICHAVGAASSVAHFDTRIAYVIAAMLHAAYDSGHFPDGRSGRSTPAHRKWLTEQIGPEIESVVARFIAFKFGEGVPEALAQAGVAKQDQDLLFIALAHEVDDMADGGLAFSPKYGQSISSRVDACVRLARQLGQEKLAQCLAEHGRRYAALTWIDDLSGGKAESGFRVVPNLRAYWRLRRDRWRNKPVEMI